MSSAPFAIGAVMSDLEMVIFECDGVIVDNERLLNEVLRDDLAQHGLELAQPD